MAVATGDGQFPALLLEFRPERTLWRAGVIRGRVLDRRELVEADGFEVGIKELAVLWPGHVFVEQGQERFGEDAASVFGHVLEHEGAQDHLAPGVVFSFLLPFPGGE